LASDEFEIIRRHFNRSELAFAVPQVPLAIGDDCALLALRSGTQLAVSMDMLQEGVHFLPDADPFLLGQRTLLVNLSDLAAMGAQPVCFTLALSLPRHDDEWLAQFSAGLARVAVAHHCPLVGGDLTASARDSAGAPGALTLCVQVHGEVPAGAGLRRSGAQVGDGIYVTGTLGDAAAGLRVLRDGAWPTLAPQLRNELVQAFQLPESRVAAGLALRDIANAAIDLSDGLASDLVHVLNASGVGARIDLDALPLSAALLAAAEPDERLQLALGGGDDYELCFTVPPERAADMTAKMTELQTPVRRIGEVLAGGGLQWWRAGAQQRLDLQGYNHFASAEREQDHG
jgi:thiamine-monophosphate kinase